MKEELRDTKSFHNKQAAPLGATNFTKVSDYRVELHKFDYCRLDVLPNSPFYSCVLGCQAFEQE